MPIKVECAKKIAALTISLPKEGRISHVLAFVLSLAKHEHSTNRSMSIISNYCLFKRDDVNFSQHYVTF